MKKTMLLILFFGLFINVYSTDIPIIDTLKIHNEIKKLGISERSINFKTTFFNSIVFLNDSICYYNPEGTLHLFEIKLGENPVVKKLSTSIFQGHNFKRLLFIQDDVIYSYGGEGLFNVFPGLIYFHKKSSSWMKKKIEDYPKDTRKVISSWKSGNKLFVLLNHFSEYDESSTHEYTNYSFGEIDLLNFKYVNKFNFNNPTITELEIDYGNYLFDSDSLLLTGYTNEDGTSRYKIFDKTKGEEFQIDFLENIPSIDGNSLLYTKGHKVYYRDNTGKLDSILIKDSMKFNRRNFIKIYNSKRTFGYLKIIIGSIILIIILFISMYFKKSNKRITENLDDSLNTILEIEMELIKKRGMNLSKNELDKVFNLLHFSYDTIKVRRGLFIQNINKRGNVNIVRIKKPDDKRFYEYGIR
jgi:hypothetical protein